MSLLLKPRCAPTEHRPTDEVAADGRARQDSGLEHRCGDSQDDESKDVKEDGLVGCERHFDPKPCDGNVVRLSG